MSSLAPLAYDFVVLIVTATLFAIVARKFNQPPLVAYILAGVVLGPVLFNVVSETSSIELFSELGLAFLLFLVGLEMKLKDIRKLIKPILRIGLLQIALQGILSASLAYVLGFTPVEIIVITLATIYSSTAIVVKLLTDKNETSTVFGKLDIGVLIIQDVFVVLVIGLFSSSTLTNVSTLLINFGEVLLLISVIGIISYLSSQKFLPKVFRRIAENEHAFFTHGIAWFFIFVSISQYFDISLEIGAFLAGLSLAQIPYNVELRERIRPLTDFFMVLFFSSIGLRMTSNSLFLYWKEAAISSVVFILGGFLIMFYLIDREKFSLETSFKGSINMTQVSEFSLVVGSLAVVNGFVSEGILGYLSLTAIITMSVSSYLIMYNEEIFRRVYGIIEFLESEEKTDAELGFLENHAIMIGHNDLGQRVLPILKDYFDDVVVVDRKSLNFDELNSSSVKFIFGDFKHGEIQDASGLHRADLIISFSGEERLNKEILELSKDDAMVFAKAHSRGTAAELYDMGAAYIIRENILTAEKIKHYLELYEENKDKLIKKIDSDKESLIWGGRSA